MRWFGFGPKREPAADPLSESDTLQRHRNGIDVAPLYTVRVPKATCDRCAATYSTWTIHACPIPYDCGGCGAKVPTYGLGSMHNCPGSALIERLDRLIAVLERRS